MSEPIQKRLEGVMALLPCRVSGCWGLHGAETSYYYDSNCECHVLEVWPVAVEEEVDEETNGHDWTEPDAPYELAEFDYTVYEEAEFDFTELIRAVPLENFHFSQRRAVFEIGWKEFGQDLELRVHYEPKGAGEGF